MKVLVVHCAYQVRGGEDTVVEEEIKLMQSLGVSVELLLFDNTKQAILKFLQLPFNISSYLKTRKKLREFQPDVVHIHNLHYAGSASVIYAVKRSHIPIVMTLHNYRLICPSSTLYFNQKLFLDSLHQTFPWTAVRRGVYKNSVPLTFWLSVSMQLHKWLGTWKYCSRFVVLSQDAKNYFTTAAKLNEEKIAVKPNFFAAEVLPASLRSDHFLYIGRLSEEKGIDSLLGAFADSSFKLKIAGQGPMLNKVVEYSRRFHNIEFLGSLSKSQVLLQMTSCTALIFPSIWLEGMPLTIIEAFACGTPVIASNMGAMRTMIQDNYNGLLFEAERKGELRNKLSEWQSLPDNAKQQYSRNARSTYEEKYTPQVNARQLLSIYSEVSTAGATVQLRI